MQEGTVLSVMLWMQGGTARGDGLQEGTVLSVISKAIIT
jgi:hypothetical protein